MQQPFPPFNWELMDVHGAGSQRSDPKIGDPNDWPHGHGPQGDVIRIFNFVRCVRDAVSEPGDPIGDLGINIVNQVINLSWSVMPGAVVYNIYQSAEPYDDWTLIGSTPNTAWSLLLESERGFFRVTWE